MLLWADISERGVGERGPEWASARSPPPLLAELLAPWPFRLSLSSLLPNRCPCPPFTPCLPTFFWR